MKKPERLNRDYFPSFDELYVISDLHLGGKPGFQIFNSGKELKQFVEHLAAIPPEKNLHLSLMVI